MQFADFEEKFSMKILLLLPDGVGVRNFVYTDFIDKTLAAGHEITLWAEKDILSLVDDKRVFKLTLPEQPATNALIEIRRKAWSVGLLKWQARIFNDPSYLDYIFTQKPDTIAKFSKFLAEKFTLITHKNRKSLYRLRKKYLGNMKKIPYYKACLAQLGKIGPDFVFCAVQRSSKAIAPVLAARELKIPNSSFIYSWDNLPKASLYVKADNYFVWSEQMKDDLLKYYPDVKAERIHITGTPQFVPYFDDSIKMSRNKFAERYKLPLNNKWICFSGDDVTTSPYDQVYLSHLANAVSLWNYSQTEKLHILFRRCPVDLSNRYDNTLTKFPDIITEVSPVWGTLNPDAGWNQIVPKIEDMQLLVNTVLHCEAVINLGSTMAHDFSILGKPALYINYNTYNKQNWDIYKIYKYSHFITMEGLNPVIWVNSEDHWQDCLMKALYDSGKVVEDCQKWHKKVALFPLEDANSRLLKAMEELA